MKKILLTIMSLLLLLSLAGCNKKTPTGGISKDWKDFEFELDGVIYKNPWSFNDFANNGWKIMDDANDDIEPKSMGFQFYMMVNDSHYDEKHNYYASITIEFDNRTEQLKKMKDCDISRLGFQKLPPELNGGIDLTDVNYQLVLAKKISFGATEAEVIAAYGDVKDVFKAQRDEYKVLQYYTLTEDNLLSIMNLTFYNDSLYAVNLYRYYVDEGYEHHGVQR